MKRTLALPLFVVVLILLIGAATKPATAPPAPPDLDKAPADAQSLGIPGFLVKQLVPPAGETVLAEDDFVRIRYTIWVSPGGKLVEWIASPGSVVRPMSRLFEGLRLALLQMKPGERRRIWIPESVAGAGRVPPGGHLVVDLDLIEVIKPPATPHDLVTLPADATITKSGPAYKVLQPGSGTKHPRRSNLVRVHYTGWTTDGKMFESSVARGEPAEFTLENVIAGWREGLQIMTEGEKTRFWIPSELAYNHEAGKPQGMLVFDVELLKILQ